MLEESYDAPRRVSPADGLRVATSDEMHAGRFSDGDKLPRLFAHESGTPMERLEVGDTVLYLVFDPEKIVGTQARIEAKLDAILALLDYSTYSTSSVSLAIRLRDSRDEWKEFIDAHQDLQPEPFWQLLNSDDAVVEAEPFWQLLNSDDAVVEALTRSQQLRGTETWATSRDVAETLAEMSAMTTKPNHGDIVKVGQALGRLAREGRVVRVSKSYERGCWATGAGS